MDLALLFPRAFMTVMWLMVKEELEAERYQSVAQSTDLEELFLVECGS